MNFGKDSVLKFEKKIKLLKNQMKNHISKLLIFFLSLTTFAGYSQSKVLSKHEMKIYTNDTSYDEIVNEFFAKFS